MTHSSFTAQPRALQLSVIPIAAAIALLTVNAHAQMAAPERSIPIRQLRSTVSSDSGVLMNIAAVRALSNGSVLVNDAVKHQLVLFDASLRQHTVIADTAKVSGNNYGLQGGAGSLIPYVGDSSLFVDAEALTFVVIDPAGRFVRTFASARASDLNMIASGQLGPAYFDGQGRVVYRSYRVVAKPTAPDESGKPYVVNQPDSAPILRMDLNLRAVDTIATMSVPIQRSLRKIGERLPYMMQVLNPLPVTDDWTLLPDGTVAVVRGHDYHVDLIADRNTVQSSPKLPIAWRRISAEGKQQLVDSAIKIVTNRLTKNGTVALSGPLPITALAPSELPDYFPALRQGQTKTDKQGNIWILPNTSSAADGGLQYDVVDGRGNLVERVQLPVGRRLAGFGEGNAVYLYNVRSSTQAMLERATLLQER